MQNKYATYTYEYKCGRPLTATLFQLVGPSAAFTDKVGCKKVLVGRGLQPSLSAFPPLESNRTKTPAGLRYCVLFYPIRSLVSLLVECSYGDRFSPEKSESSVHRQRFASYFSCSFIILSYLNSRERLPLLPVFDRCGGGFGAVPR